MLSPEDIRRVEFSKALRGYHCEEVDDYLKQVAQDLENSLAAQEELRRQLNTLVESVTRFRSREDTLANALLNVQSMGDRIQKDAKQKAVEIVREANIRAENREQQSRETVEQLKSEQERLRREVSHFRANILSMYEAHIHSLSSLPVLDEPAPENSETAIPDAPAAEETPEVHAATQPAPRPIVQEPALPKEAAGQPALPDLTPPARSASAEKPVLPGETKAPRRRTRATVQPSIPDEPDTQEFGEGTGGTKGRKKTPSLGAVQEDANGGKHPPVLPDPQEPTDEEPLKSMFGDFNGIGFYE